MSERVNVKKKSPANAADPGAKPDATNPGCCRKG